MGASTRLSVVDDAAVQRAMAEAARVTAADAESIAQQAAAVIHREFPQFSDDPETFRETALAVQHSLEALTDMVRRGEAVAAGTAGPEAFARARSLARSGESVEVLIRLAQMSHGLCLAAWEDRLGRLQLPADVLMAAARKSQMLTFGWMDRVLIELTTAYQEEHDRLVRSGQVEHVQSIRALLAGAPHDAGALSLTLGYDLRLHHTALVLWVLKASGDAHARLEAAANAAAQHLGASRALTLPVPPATLWAWIGTAAAPSSLDLNDVARRHDVIMAVGEPALGPAGFRASHEDAQNVARLGRTNARRSGTCMAYRQVQLAAMLAGDTERVRRFVRQELGELAADSDEQNRLRATLRVFLEEHGSRQVTANRLGIHTNTVGNRVRTCEELLGVSLERHRMELLVALALAQRFGAAVLD